MSLLYHTCTSYGNYWFTQNCSNHWGVQTTTFRNKSSEIIIICITWFWYLQSDNILVGEDCTIKISDFGFARRFEVRLTSCDLRACGVVILNCMKFRLNACFTLWYSVISDSDWWIDRWNQSYNSKTLLKMWTKPVSANYNKQLLWKDHNKGGWVQQTVSIYKCETF